MLQALGKQLGIAYSAELKVDAIDTDLATGIPIGFAKQHRLLAVRREGEVVMVAMADPLDMGALDDLRMQLGAEVQPVLVPAQRILEVINDVYGRKHDKGGDLGEKAKTRTTRAGARSWSTSSRSPTRRRSSAGSTR